MQDQGHRSSTEFRPGRRHDLDRLRILAFLLLAVTHTGNLFVSWGDWPIRSGHTSWSLERFLLFVSLWRLPLVFFVSGAGAAFSLRSRGPGGFTWERFRRLLPPLMGGVFLIAPLQVWMQARYAGLTGESFLEFLPRAWASGPSPQGFLGWQHLWFVGYLLVFCLLLAAIHLLATRHPAWTGWAAGLMGWRGAFLLVGFVPALLTALLGPGHPPSYVLYDDWWNLSLSLGFFLMGYAIARVPGGFDRLAALRGRALALGLLSAGLLFTQDWLGIRTFIGWTPTWHFFTKGFAAFAWVTAIAGFAGAHLNRPASWLAPANEAVFPFFIWHLPVMWAVGILLADLRLGFPAEFALAVALTFAGTAAVVRWAVYPFDPMRLLFGLKPRDLAPLPELGAHDKAEAPTD